VTFLRTAVLATALGLGACAEEAARPELGLAVASLSGDGLPDDVEVVRVTWRVGDGDPTTREATLDQLERSGGRTRLNIERIPENTPIELTVEGVRADDKVGYAGHVGPLSLGKDEQAKVRVVLFNRAVSETFEGDVPPGRFLHTATRLADGRVLIAGGFGAPRRESCPDGIPAGSLCFTAAARQDAWIFEPTGATFTPLAGGFMTARGGHTATVLDDGSVLFAGGAKSVMVVLAIDELGFSPRFVGTGLADFERFDPRPAGATDARAPGRGRFVAGGALKAPRFMHAAEANPLAPARVLLAGGVDAAASGTYEVFDREGPMGAGVLSDSLVDLSVPRALPSALAMRDGQAGWIWLIGGASATSNDDLAERWLGDADNAVGSVMPATESAFPNASGDDDSPQPLYALTRPVAVTLSNQSRAFVTGGLGPRCDEGGVTVFAGEDTLPCSDADQLRVGFLTEAATGATVRAKLPSAHLLGAGAALADGRAAVSGGFLNRTLEASAGLHVLVFTSELRAGDKELVEPRALHTSTGFGAAGLLSTGGVRFENEELELVEASEVLWL
jgi:hypothetical protein